jgi:hypothetical protein
MCFASIGVWLSAPMDPPIESTFLFFGRSSREVK